MLRFFLALLGVKPRDAVYGFTAIAARRELLAVRRRHRELLEECRRGAANYDDVEQNIGRIDEIEARYFGRSIES